jgi:beta-lactamase regulating signal transducer with metallopeptidase domain
MNAFGISLVWCALQVAFVLLVTILLYATVRKWGQAARATSLGAGLALTLLLSFLVFSPWPNWWQLRSGNAEPSHEVTVDYARDDHVSASGNSGNVVESPEPNLTAPETELESPMSAFVTTFVDSLGSPPEPSEVAVRDEISWLAIIGYVFLAGLAMGAIRLVVGCWRLLTLHRQGRSIDDRELLDLLLRLREELGCRREVELRESAEITPAATFGWKRPVILLSPDWRTWTADERQAVLAHELAHVCRGDFLTELWAQLGTLLHFYHPLVRWLTAQLRLEQELATDALAASVSGGSQKHLRVLAEIALREPSRSMSWPVRPFLPTRHTFLRRIEMLSDSKTIEQPIRWGLRAGLLLLVTCVGIAAAGIRKL